MYGDAYCRRVKNDFCDHPRNAVHFQMSVVFSKLKMHAIT